MCLISMETQIVHIIDPMLDHELEEQLARLHRTRKGRMQPRSTKGNSTLIHCDDIFIYIKRKSNVFFLDAYITFKESSV